METPCIDVCQINQANGCCEGCWRTIAEITAWAKMTPAQRRRIMDDLPSRAHAAKTMQRGTRHDIEEPAPDGKA